MPQQSLSKRIDYSDDRALEAYLDRTDHDLALLARRYQLPAGLRRAVVLPERLDHTTAQSSSRYYRLLSDLQRWYPKMMILPFPLPQQPEGPDGPGRREQALGLVGELSRVLDQADLVVRPGLQAGPARDEMMDLALQVVTAAGFRPGVSVFTPGQLHPETGLVHAYSQLIGCEIAVTNSYVTGETFEHTYRVAVPAPELGPGGVQDLAEDDPDWVVSLLDFTGEGGPYCDIEAYYEVEILACPAMGELVGVQTSSQG